MEWRAWEPWKDVTATLMVSCSSFASSPFRLMLALLCPMVHALAENSYWTLISTAERLLSCLPWDLEWNLMFLYLQRNNMNHRQAIDQKEKKKFDSRNNAFDVCTSLSHSKQTRLEESTRLISTTISTMLITHHSPCYKLMIWLIISLDTSHDVNWWENISWLTLQGFIQHVIKLSEP